MKVYPSLRGLLLLLLLLLLGRNLAAESNNYERLILLLNRRSLSLFAAKFSPRRRRIKEQKASDTRGNCSMREHPAGETRAEESLMLWEANAAVKERKKHIKVRLMTNLLFLSSLQNSQLTPEIKFQS